MSGMTSVTATTAPDSKWRILGALGLAELLAMAPWFSASAVVAALTAAWKLDDSGRAWLTMSVQIGFVAGALASALLNLPDRIAAHKLFAWSALLTALVTALIPLAGGNVPLALALRFLTGVFLAGVYPVGMKIVATWTKQDRGLGIGFIVGALTLGSASPHLLNAFGGVRAWQPVLYLAAGSAALGGIIAANLVREGPYHTKTPPFDLRYIAHIARDRYLVLTNLGYLGHMWELFAMWAWVVIFLLESFKIRGVSAGWASLSAFAIIGIGGLGSLIAGMLADRMGRTTVTIASLVVSGCCALIVGRFFGGNPVWLVIICLVWGFAVVADSAQYSACISELCPPAYMGTALTLQTSLGFLLTLVTISGVPTLSQSLGWDRAFAVLALGPAVGIAAMALLRLSPAARRLAGGRG